jgi:hypothetical protein
MIRKEIAKAKAIRLRMKNATKTIANISRRGDGNQ